MASERTYQRRIKALLDIIEMMHWVQPHYNGSPSCAWCGEQQHRHKGHCKVSQLLEKTYGPDEIRIEAVRRG